MNKDMLWFLDMLILSKGEAATTGGIMGFSLLISFKIMLNFAQNSRSKFTDSLFYCITTPSPRLPPPFIFLILSVCSGSPIDCCFLVSGTLVHLVNTTGHTHNVCATFCIDSRIKFRLLAFCCPKSLSASQTVNRFGHITNSVSVEKATLT